MRAGYAFITPMLIGLLVFTSIPFLYSLYLAFTDYNGMAKPEWVGWGNFVKMLTDDEDFWHSLGVTFRYCLINVPLKQLVALLAAVLISKKTKLTGAYRLVLYLPSLIGGTVAMAVTFIRLFATNGAINQLLGVIGIEPIKWFAVPAASMAVLIISAMLSIGSIMLIYLAGLKNVPNNLMEAATVDGASPLIAFIKIKIPMLTPIIFYNFVMGMIGSLQTFSGAYLITEGGPAKATLFYGLYQYQMAFARGHMGYASAMAWFFMLIILILTALVFKSSGAWVYYQDEG